MPEFHHRHWSGLWDAKATAWERMVHAGTLGVDVLTVTETTVHHPDPPAGWGKVWRSEAPDAALYYERATWALVDATGMQIAHTTYILGGKKPKPPLHALVVTLEHKATKRRVVFAVVHQPSAIEGEVYRDQSGTALRFPRIAAYFQGIRGLHHAKRLARKASPGAAWLFIEDSNLDWHKAWVRAFTKARFPRLTCSWKQLPKAGTHGKRLIDVALYSRQLTTTGSELGKAMAPFDHTPFETTYRFKKDQ